MADAEAVNKEAVDEVLKRRCGWDVRMQLREVCDGSRLFDFYQPPCDLQKQLISLGVHGFRVLTKREMGLHPEFLRKLRDYV